MKFISAQTHPRREYQDENGKWKSEPVSHFSDVTVEENESLGFKPLWAIPITTFKETLTSMLLTAPNFPRLLCIFDTEDYTRVDKIKYYQNLRDEQDTIPIASDDLPDHLTEYCLNLDSLRDEPTMANVEEIANFRDDHGDLVKCMSNTNKYRVPDNINQCIRDYVNKIPEMNLNAIEQFESLGNAELRAYLQSCWVPFKYTILPILLYELCEDTCNRQVTFQPYTNNAKTNNKVVIANSNQYSNMVALESCINNIQPLLKLEKQMAIWSYSDCSETEFEHIYQSVKDHIIDSDPVLKAMFIANRQIERNDQCPCGSGLKFKKCHGKYL